MKKSILAFILIFISILSFGQNRGCIQSAFDSPWAFTPDLLIGGSKSQLDAIKRYDDGRRCLIKYLWYVMKVDDSDTLNYVELCSYASGGDEKFTTMYGALTYFDGAAEWMEEHFGKGYTVVNPHADLNLITVVKEDRLSERVKHSLCYASAWQVCEGVGIVLWMSVFPSFGDQPAQYSTYWVAGKSVGDIRQLYTIDPSCPSRQ